MRRSWETVSVQHSQTHGIMDRRTGCCPALRFLSFWLAQCLNKFEARFGILNVHIRLQILSFCKNPHLALSAPHSWHTLKALSAARPAGSLPHCWPVFLYSWHRRRVLVIIYQHVWKATENFFLCVMALSTEGKGMSKGPPVVGRIGESIF